MQAVIVVLMLVLVLVRIFLTLVFRSELLGPWRVLQNMPCVYSRTRAADHFACAV
jgi:hypothetical protein